VLRESTFEPLHQLGEQYDGPVLVHGRNLVLPRQSVDQRAGGPREVLECVTRVMSRSDELAQEIAASHAVTADELLDEALERDGAWTARGRSRSLKVSITVSGISLRHGPAPSEGMARRSSSPRSLRS
jgi:hypothetical protein